MSLCESSLGLQTTRLPDAPETSDPGNGLYDMTWHLNFSKDWLLGSWCANYVKLSKLLHMSGLKP